MKPVDIVLGVLTLFAVGLGVAAYRAWHPDVEQAVSQPAVAVEPLPSRSPAPAFSVRRLTPIPVPPFPLQAGSEGGVRCWKGLVYRQTHWHWVPVYSPDGRVSQCEIQAEPVRLESSQASDDNPARWTR